MAQKPVVSPVGLLPTGAALRRLLHHLQSIAAPPRMEVVMVPISTAAVEDTVQTGMIRQPRTLAPGTVLVAMAD